MNKKKPITLTFDSDDFELTQKIIDSAPVIINLWDDKYNIINTSKTALERYGLSSYEEYYDQFFSLSPERQPCGTLSREKALYYLTKAYEKGRVQFEWMHKNTEGKLIPSDVTLVRTEHNGKTMIIAYNIDLRNIKAAEAFSKKLLDSSPLIMESWDVDGNLIDCNKKMMDTFGVTHRDELIRRFFEFSAAYQPCGTPADKKNKQMIEEALENGQSRSEWAFVLPNGTIFPTETTWVHVEHGGQSMIIVYSQDLSPIKEDINRERALEKHFHEQEVTERVRLMFDATPLIIEYWDKDYNPIDCNETTLKFYDLTCKQEYKKNRVNAQFHTYTEESATIKLWNAHLNEIFMTGSGSFEIIEKLPSGNLAFLKVRGMRMKYNEDYVVVTYTVNETSLIESEREVVKTRVALDYREKLSDTINQVAKILLTSNEDNFFGTLTEGMEVVGRCVNVDRVQIWRNEMIDGQLHFVMRYEWLSELGKEKIEVPIGLSAPYSDWPHWYDMFLRGKSINTPIVELPTDAAEFLGYYEMVSIVLLPMFMNNELIGFFSVDDCLQSRTFTDDEMDLFASAGLMFSAVFNQMEKANEIKTAQEQERAAIEEASEMIGMLLDASPLSIEIWDDKFNLIDCNNQVMGMYELEDKDEFLENYFDFSPELQPCGTPSREKCEALLKLAMDEGSAHSEWVHLTKSQKEVPIELSYVRLARMGGYIIVGYNHDLSQIKKAMAEMQRIEVAEASNQAKSRFLARMSHEIRTPISAVLGISEIQLQAPGLSPQVEEAFAKIHNSATLLLSTVNDILDLSKIEAGKMELMQEEYELASMISDVAHMHLGYLSEKKVRFELNIDENLPAMLVGDVLRIEQILNNLLSNAFKYTDDGIVTMSMEVQKGENDNVELIISVKDTGQGMSQEQLEILSNSEYVRFNEQDNRFVSGTGLGIPIVTSLLSMMNARMELESEVGTGTEVKVRIPQKKMTTQVLGKDLAIRLQKFEESARASAKRFRFTPEPMPYGRVLIVDDVEANLYVAKGLLAFYDLNIETCDSGQKAIDKIKAGNKYDLIFMDHMMPDLNGIDTMLMIREMGYTQPIVALTANALIGQAEMFISKGFDGFISKPIQTGHLNSILLKHIRDKQTPEVIEAAKAQVKETEKNIHNFQDDAELLKKLRHDFATKHRETYVNIGKANDEKDMKKLRYYAHTLKGVAGLIKEKKLSKICEKIEYLAAKSETPESTIFVALGEEFEHVHASINLSEVASTELKLVDNSKIKTLFNELEVLLKDRNADAMGLTDELKAIPQAIVLATLIEEYEFNVAAKVLTALRATMGV